ncbi:hypothetical protein ACRE_083600 [Hapsidospora chrysogenum ATCC 11550]|uniref:Uncharacterized protein n=1 Tax=Hapsidospora chrysogenum (strain ATCC 11550 / CBS 779.69 / DSM 880 / IAM 14645 / JCM 23072 / IMI 49137) TaxID=857340 RepID=A0A086SV00_HAPC1|nr:hypothetical protein ACRE_083600 [Hapsidospora chrysogenum ATCC 11550]
MPRQAPPPASHPASVPTSRPAGSFGRRDSFFLDKNDPALIAPHDPRVGDTKGHDLEGFELGICKHQHLRDGRDWPFWHVFINAQLRAAGAFSGTILSVKGDQRLLEELDEVCEDAAQDAVHHCDSGVDALRTLEELFSQPSFRRLCRIRTTIEDLQKLDQPSNGSCSFSHLEDLDDSFSRGQHRLEMLERYFDRSYQPLYDFWTDKARALSRDTRIICTGCYRKRFVYKFEHVVRNEREKRDRDLRSSGPTRRETGPHLPESGVTWKRRLPLVIDETDPDAHGKAAIDLNGLDLQVEQGSRLRCPEQWVPLRRVLRERLGQAGARERGTVITAQGDARLFGQLLSFCEGEALRVIMFCHSGLQAGTDLEIHFSRCSSLPDPTAATTATTATTTTATDEDMEEVIWIPNPNIQAPTITIKDEDDDMDVKWVPRTNSEVVIPMRRRT